VYTSDDKAFAILKVYVVSEMDTLLWTASWVYSYAARIDASAC